MQMRPGERRGMLGKMQGEPGDQPLHIGWRRPDRAHHTHHNANARTQGNTGALRAGPAPGLLRLASHEPTSMVRVRFRLKQAARPAGHD